MEPSTTKLDETGQELRCKMNFVQQIEVISNMIAEFFFYWPDDGLEIRAIDEATKLLIKHSRNVKQNNDNDLEDTMSEFERLHRLGCLNLHTLHEVINDFFRNVKLEKCDNLFDWDCLIIIFTVARELSIKYPHLYPHLDLIDMLCGAFYLAGNDSTVFGCWNNFKSYSTQFLM